MKKSGRRRSEQGAEEDRPSPSSIRRPASAENFMSEREVINMLGDLHRQKVHAETQASMLQEQISHLRKQIETNSDETQARLSPETREARDGHRTDDTLFELDVSSEMNAAAEEAQRKLTEHTVTSELDNFIRLRSYIMHMQQGASLLLWKEDGLQLCWFWLDKDCLSLNWDVDETESGEGGGAAQGASLLLERIVDIVPLGAGADQLTDSPTDSSFSIQLEGSRLDIVAPTSLDFQVWYFGLAFATRLRLNALQGMQETGSESNSGDTASRNAAGVTHAQRRASEQESESESERDRDSEAASVAAGNDENGAGGRMGGSQKSPQRFHSAGRRREVGGGGAGGARSEGGGGGGSNIEEKVDEQRRMIEKLQRENHHLKEVRRSKDQAIERLLHDLQVSLCLALCPPLSPSLSQAPPP
jgi:hypothetical protein